MASGLHLLKAKPVSAAWSSQPLNCRQAAVAVLPTCEYGKYYKASQRDWARCHSQSHGRASQPNSPRQRPAAQRPPNPKQQYKEVLKPLPPGYKHRVLTNTPYVEPGTQSQPSPPQDQLAPETSGDSGNNDVLPTIQLDLPAPEFTQVKTAEYMTSCVDYKACPAPKYPEFAVIGRSNVGKSSLINMLTNRTRLAQVSKEPGKTRCINHFIINNSWYLVDLPGYGYAKQSLNTRHEFDQFTREYLVYRPNLAMTLLLVDASIPPQEVDVAYANWLAAAGVPFCIAFTKADKRKKGGPKWSENVLAFKKALLATFAYLPPSVITSAEAGAGRVELLHLIASLRQVYEGSGSLAAAQTAWRQQQQQQQQAAAAAAAGER